MEHRVIGSFQRCRKGKIMEEPLVNEEKLSNDLLQLANAEPKLMGCCNLTPCRNLEWVSTLSSIRFGGLARAGIALVGY
jgi:hypothetical protein